MYIFKTFYIKNINLYTIKELKDAGIIKGEISGVKTCYCIDENNWTKMGVLFNKIFDAYTNTKKCC